MGQEIVYCHECQSRLVGSEFDKGKAFRIQNQNYCLACAQKLLQSLPPHERDAFAAHMTAHDGRKSTQRIPVVQDPRAHVRTGDSGRHAPFRPDSTNARLAAMPPKKEKSPLLWIGLAGGALALVAVVLVAGSGGGSVRSSAPNPPPTGGSDGSLAPPVDVKLAEARRLLEAAKAYAAANPGDAVGQMDRFSKAAWHAPGSPVATAALAEIDALRARTRARQERELAELDRQVAALAAKKDYAAAQRLLEAAKGRHLDTDWSLAVKRRLEQVAGRDGATSTSPPPAPPPPPPPASSGTPPIVVYDDKLQSGWLDHSWASEVDFACADPFYEGSRSIRWTPKAFAAGLYLGPSLEQPLEGLVGVSFALRGLEPQLPVEVLLWTDMEPEVRIPLSRLGPPAPGEWKTYVLPFKDLGVRGRILKAVVFQAFRQENQKPLACVDAVSILRGPVEAAPAAAGAWTPFEVVETRSSQGTPLSVEPDGVIVASGPNPARDTYVVRLKSSLKAVHAIRLDALAHPSMPGGGPGRSDGNGNFVLTELRVEAGGKPVAFQDVVADYSQPDWAVEGAFDGHSLTGWAIHPACGRDHHMIVRLREPVNGADVTVTLEQESPHDRHVLGRFRLSATALRLPDPPAGTPALPSPAVLASRRTWYAAARHAAARDYAAAIREFEPAAKAGGDEGAADLADFRLAAKLHEEALGLLTRWPIGWNLEAEVLLPDGTRRRVNEPVRAVRGTYVALRDPGGLPGIEAGQMTAASLADLVLARRPTPQDVRAAGLLCAFEGDLEAARKHLGGLPTKFEAHARSLPAVDDAAEADARRRLLEAETAWADPVTRAAAADGFSALLKDRAATLLVRRCAAGLRARGETPPEYVFGPGDLATGGYFGAQRHPKGELAWTMGLDVPAKERAANYVEAAYSVRAGTELRGWALVGGCCAETFTFGVTATDLAPASPEQAAIDVLPPIPFLKRAHSVHGGPKQAARFEWAALPALKHAEGGAKHLRILSDQEGFSVVAIVLSGARTKPPSESELRELLAGRPLPETTDAAPSGTILMEVWENVSGSDIAALTAAMAKPPTRTSELKSFSSPQNSGDNYGTRIRGYVHPPETGAYVFYVCSDDDGELWLSSDDRPDKKKKIAWTTEAMGFDDWDGSKPRASAPVTLQKGRRYYIEGLQKEGGGSDHLRAGWKLPDGTLERPIPGLRLSSWDPARPRRAPEIVVEGEAFPEGAAVALGVDLSGIAASRVEIFQGGTRLGEARGTPPSYTWTQVPVGAHALWARIQERSGRVVNTPVVSLRVGDIHLVRAVNLNGPALKLDGGSWSEGSAAVVTGQGFERLDVDLRPDPRRTRAQMIRASVAAREGTQVAVGVPAGKYLVYLTLWEPEGPPSPVDLLVNGKVVVAGHRFAAPGDWARLGPWPAEAADGRITVSAARGAVHFCGLEVWSLGAPPKPGQRAHTRIAGSTGGTPFEEAGPDGLWLTGIRVSQQDGILSSVRPIWGDKARGEYRGTSGGAGTDLDAKPGYALGAVELRLNPTVTALKVVFFRIQGDRLDPGDRYESAWYPGPPGSSPTQVVGGDGNPVIGLVGRAGKAVDALGLIQLR